MLANLQADRARVEEQLQQKDAQIHQEDIQIQQLVIELDSRREN